MPFWIDKLISLIERLLTFLSGYFIGRQHMQQADEKRLEEAKDDKKKTQQSTAADDSGALDVKLREQQQKLKKLL